MTAPFYRSFRDYFRDLPTGARAFWIIVIATGCASGLVAAAFMQLLRFVQDVAWPHAPTYLGAIEAADATHRVVVPVIAGCIITALWLATREKLSGHGTPGVIEAIWHREGNMALPPAFMRDASSIVAVSMGASLGREGALIQTSAATGSWLSQRFSIDPEQRRLLVACGAAAGIAAAYNVPIGASVFGLEVLLGSFALELFGPIVVCCVSATLVSRILIEDHATYAVPHFALTTPRAFALVLVLGPILGLAGALYNAGMDGVARVLGRIPKPYAFAMPILAMGALGAAAIWFPQLLGNGYDSVDRSMLGAVPLTLLIALPVLKFLATAVCSGSGVPGGLFTPSLYVGALLGGALGAAAEAIAPGAPAGAYALIGMGCILAGTTHAAVSSVLIVFELTGDYDVILPLMLGCVIAAHISRRLVRESIYTASLRRRNVQLPEHATPRWLRRTTVAELVKPDAATIPLTLPFAQVVVRLLAQPAGHDLYVVADDGKYVGLVALEAVKIHLPDEAHLGAAIAVDVLDPVPPIAPSMTLAELAQRFALLPHDRLAVVDPDTGAVLGTVSKRDLMRVGRY
ncbi:MAG TPA: chloride channel protein [Kofleriaceae bacterium]|nr:chloride channel protein [Kofleriaceae bacterium]